MEGAAAAQIEQRIVSCSQFTYPRLGEVGSAAKSATES